ncbi:hypothetical protein [Thiocapsa sp.]|nr:hypothetical protein [Thiocapsa sp.]
MAAETKPIARRAIAQGLPLVHNDRDFDHFPSIKPRRLQRF